MDAGHLQISLPVVFLQVLQELGILSVGDLCFVHIKPLTDASPESVHDTGRDVMKAKTFQILASFIVAERQDDGREQDGEQGLR